MKNRQESSNIVDRIWNFFSSIKLTIIILLLLAVTSIFGTLIPQNENPAAYIQTYGEFLFRLFRVLDIFDMYHSWWFQMMIGMLTINIVVCSLKRFPATWKIVSAKTPRFNPGRGRKSVEYQEFSDKRSPAELVKAYKPYISGKFRFNRIESSDSGYFMVAEKGRWTRLGVYSVHLSVLLLLIGALIGSILGFDGYVNIPEGEAVDRIQLRNSSKSLPLGFKIRCDDFNVSFYDSGTPKEFRSRLTVLENGQAAVQKDIIVNDPLRYKGINMFQSSYGSMQPKNLVLNFTNRKTGNRYRQKATIGQTFEMPESTGKFTVREFRGDYQIGNINVGNTFVGVLERPDTEAIEVALPLKFPTIDKMRKGVWIISVEEIEQRYYTGLQVTKDPGVNIVYAGFIIMILGCYVAFFMSHQKVAVEVMQSANSSSVRVSGTASRNSLSMQKRVQKIAADLAAIEP